MTKLLVSKILGLKNIIPHENASFTCIMSAFRANAGKYCGHRNKSKIIDVTTIK